MKNLIMIIGIICIVACIIAFLYAGLNYHTYRNLFDGSAELYKRLHNRAIIFAVVGTVLLLAGASAMVLSFFV